MYLRTNVQIASKIHDEILSNVPGAIVETSIGADGKRISYKLMFKCSLKIIPFVLKTRVGYLQKRYAKLLDTHRCLLVRSFVTLQI